MLLFWRFPRVRRSHFPDSCGKSVRALDLRLASTYSLTDCVKLDQVQSLACSIRRFRAIYNVPASANLFPRGHLAVSKDILLREIDTSVRNVHDFYIHAFDC